MTYKYDRPTQGYLIKNNPETNKLSKKKQATIIEEERNKQINTWEHAKNIQENFKYNDKRQKVMKYCLKNEKINKQQYHFCAQLLKQNINKSLEVNSIIFIKLINKRYDVLWQSYRSTYLNIFG